MADTNIFICSIYHYNRLVYCGLKEMWFISGKKGSLISLTAFPIHELIEKLENGVVDILPAVHALTGTFYMAIVKFSWIMH